MVDDVGEVVGRQPVVDRHQHGTDLGHGVKRLQLLVDIGRDVGHPVTLANAHRLERCRPPVAAVEKLLVGEPDAPLDHGFPLRVQSPRPAHEIERRQRRVHNCVLLASRAL